ncbi:hypothetical protein BGZ72_003343 [Mortierella alpina]|nr:hypothetical protein BGZ72_003343 [Mortierella alpina]
MIQDLGNGEPPSQLRALDRADYIDEVQNGVRDLQVNSDTHNMQEGLQGDPRDSSGSPAQEEDDYEFPDTHTNVEDEPSLYLDHARDRVQTTCVKPSAPKAEHSAPVYNILLLGQTQAGKSTLLEGIKRYVDPDYVVNDAAIGDGFGSHTESVHEVKLDTQFPEYRVLEADSVQEVDVEELCDKYSEGIMSRLGRTKDRVVQQRSTSLQANSTIHIFDTPGLDDTNGHDEKNVATVLTALSEAKATEIHLILIVLSRQTPMTPGLQNALRTYQKIFSAMNGLMTVVYTKVEDYSQLSINRKTATFLRKSSEMLNELMQQNIPYQLIDCDLDETRPIHIYFRQQAIRRILLLAKFNIPVALNRMQLYKTPKMLDIDEIIFARYREQLDTVTSRLKMRKTVDECDSNILEAQYKIRELNENLLNHDTQDLELIEEFALDGSWDMADFVPWDPWDLRTETVFKCPKIDYQIGDLRKDGSGVDITEEEGGIGYSHWSVKVNRQRLRSCNYRAKLYAKRCNKYKHEIAKCKSELADWEAILKECRLKRGSLEEESASEDASSDAKMQARCWDMMARARRKTLHLNLFRAMAMDGVFEGALLDCVRKLESFYQTYVPTEGEEASLGPHPSQRLEP